MTAAYIPEKSAITFTVLSKHRGSGIWGSLLLLRFIWLRLFCRAFLNLLVKAGVRKSSNLAIKF
jgi:hypothetical protein